MDNQQTEKTVDPVSATSVAPVSHQEIIHVSELVLRHPIMVECQRRIDRALALPAGYDILLVVGPTGAGKTTLMSTLLSSPVGGGLALPSLARALAPGAIPVISVKAHNGKTFPSRWKALLLDILKAVNPALFELGKLSDPQSTRLAYAGTMLEKVSIPRLLSLVTEGLRLRQTRAVLVDESQHLAPTACAEDLRLMAESLKDLGSNAGTVLVLFGDYTLLDFLGVSAQLARRSSPIHFRRYMVDDETDYANFQRIVFSFSKAAPTLLPFDQLSGSLHLLYFGCLGSTGTLAQWLERAMGEAILAGSPSVTVPLLEATMLAGIQYTQMVDQINLGEEKYAKMFSPLKSLMASVLGTALPAAPAAPKRAHPQLKPGQRKPTRDQTGPDEVPLAA